MTYDTVHSVDWSTWDPTWRATLLFLFRRDEVLLIHKKRGFGQGKINGPGGHIEPGESPIDAAVREVQEETGLTPLEPAACGELYFQFRDGLTIHGHVFRADRFAGDVVETDEAVPFWCGTGEMPYERMWDDDRYWVPHMFARRPFVGRFLFDSDRMVDYLIELS